MKAIILVIIVFLALIAGCSNNISQKQDIEVVTFEIDTKDAVNENLMAQYIIQETKDDSFEVWQKARAKKEKIDRYEAYKEIYNISDAKRV